MEFVDSVGDFEPLKQHQERRRGLIQDLLGIISSHTYRKFGVTVEVEAVDAEFADRNKLEYAPNALALAGELACGQALLWAKAKGFPVPEFVFEDGDPGSANVWQWVADWFDKKYYEKSPDADPLGPTTGQYRVLRGGSWNNLPGGMRASARARGEPSTPNFRFGFRCAGELRSPPPW